MSCIHLRQNKMRNFDLPTNEKKLDLIICISKWRIYMLVSMRSVNYTLMLSSVSSRCFCDAVNLSYAVSKLVCGRYSLFFWSLSTRLRKPRFSSVHLPAGHLRVRSRARFGFQKCPKPVPDLADEQK